MYKLNLPKGLTFQDRLTLLRWRDPIVFFTEVTGNPPFFYQTEMLKDLPDFDVLRMMACAAGNTGKTRLFASVALWSATILSNIILRQPYPVIIESGSQEQSRILYDYLKTWIENKEILSKLVKGEPLKTNTEFKDGSFIKALPASWKSVFGQHAALVIIDEAVEAGGELIDDSLRVIGTYRYQDKSIGRVILGSTPHTYLSRFVTMWENKKDFNIWKRYSWSALDCPLYTEEVIEEGRKKGDMYFDIFMLGKPYPLIGTMISINQVKRASKGIPIFSYDKEFGYTVLGIDWGFAPAPTAAVLIQRNEDQIQTLLYKEFLKTDPDKVLDWIETIAKEYHVDRIFTDSHNKHMNAFLTKRALPVFPISFTGEKGLMQANLASLFDRDVIKIPEEYVRLLWQLRQYTYTTKGKDDLVDAMMLACRSYKKISSSELYFKKFRPRKKKERFPFKVS